MRKRCTFRKNPRSCYFQNHHLITFKAKIYEARVYFKTCVSSIDNLTTKSGTCLLPKFKLFWRRSSISQLFRGFLPSLRFKNVRMGRHNSIYLSLFKYCFFSRDSCCSLKRLAFVCNQTRCFHFFSFLFPFSGLQKNSISAQP